MKQITEQKQDERMTSKITVRVSPGLKKAVDRKARAMHLTVTNFVRAVLAEAAADNNNNKAKLQ